MAYKVPTHEEFIDRLSIISPDIKVITQYDRSYKYMIVEDELGIRYKTKPVKLIKGQKPQLRSAINKNEGFALRAKDIHGNKYDYTFTIYNGAQNKLAIWCPNHGYFYQTADSHLHGIGCPDCGIENAKKKWAENGFSKTQWIKYCVNKNPLVYIIKCYNKNEQFVKIGITAGELDKRFMPIPYKVEIIKVIPGEAKYTFELEKELHKRYNDFKYIPLKKFDGYRECFKTLILTDDGLV